MPRYRLPLTAVALLAVPLLTVLLSGCGGGGSATKQDAGSANGVARTGPAAGSAGSVTGAISGGAAGGAPAQAKVPLQQRDVVRTATVSVSVRDIDRAAQQALAATAAAGGRADTDERSGNDADRHARLVLRVPAAGLDELLAKVVALGHETSRAEQGSDVTTEVADVNARVTELQISVGRLQDFLRHSGSITDLLALESQLTKRQSDLQSTLAQQRALADQVDLATLTVEFNPSEPAASARSAGLPGFLGAARSSLHALVFAGRLAVALLGYLAPFLLVLVAAGYFGLRYRRARRPQQDASA